MSTINRMQAIQRAICEALEVQGFVAHAHFDIIDTKLMIRADRGVQTFSNTFWLPDSSGDFSESLKREVQKWIDHLRLHEPPFWESV